MSYFLGIVISPSFILLKRYKGNPILRQGVINGLKNESEMQVFHIRSISKDRLVNKLGKIETHEIDRAIKTLNEILRY